MARVIYVFGLPDMEYMLHAKAHQCDTHPAAKSGEDGFPSGAHEFDNIRVQADGSHRHDNEKFT